MRQAILATLSILVLAGCSVIPVDPAKLSAEQLKEVVKDKSATIGCGAVQTPYKISTIFVNLDKGVNTKGTVTVTKDCDVTIENK